MNRLLVVDDELRIRGLLHRVLTDAGFGVDTAETGQQALTMTRATEYHFIVLDLMLPDIHGLVVLERVLATRPQMGVLVLSAVPEIGPRVRALDLGAVDFLPKPFSVDELLARIRARIRMQNTEPINQPGRRLTVCAEEIALDAEHQHVRFGQRSIALSHREFGLLSHLMQHRGQACTRTELLDAVWGYQFDPGTNVVDVYIRRLRTKLRPADLIRTVRNVGYSFV